MEIDCFYWRYSNETNNSKEQQDIFSKNFYDVYHSYFGYIHINTCKFHSTYRVILGMIKNTVETITRFYPGLLSTEFYIKHSYNDFAMTDYNITCSAIHRMLMIHGIPVRRVSFNPVGRPLSSPLSSPLFSSSVLFPLSYSKWLNILIETNQDQKTQGNYRQDYPSYCDGFLFYEATHSSGIEHPVYRLLPNSKDKSGPAALSYLAARAYVIAHKPRLNKPAEIDIQKLRVAVPGPVADLIEALI